MKNKTFSRQELYDLIWSTPMTTVAKQFDISDSGLRKICIRMEIPLPKAGHWQKLRAGKKVEKFLLSQNYSGDLSITLSQREVSISTGKKNYAVIELQQQLETDPNKIIVSQKLTSKDKRITAVHDHMVKKKWLHHGLVSSDRDQLDIKVSPANVSRALRFMDALIKWLELRGHQISIDHQTEVVVGKERLQIILRERTKKGGMTSWGSPENVPTGELYFYLKDYPYKEWKDGEKKLEEQLPAIVARIEVQGKELLDVQVEWEKKRVERNAKDQIRKEKIARKEKELNDFKRLIKDSERWQKIKLIRDYVNDIESSAKKNDTISDELSNWITWAKEKLDWYDPSIAKEDELLKDVNKETLEFQNNNYYNFINDTDEITT
jgi:hypothetical protein